MKVTSEVTSDVTKMIYRVLRWHIYLTTLEREWRGYKIAVGGYCSSQWLYFISYLTSLIIFFNKKY